MKIYWKNLIWNYTVRYWHLFKYNKQGLNKSKWKSFYYPHKRFWNSKQYIEGFNKFKNVINYFLQKPEIQKEMSKQIQKEFLNQIFKSGIYKTKFWSEDETI